MFTYYVKWQSEPMENPLFLEFRTLETAQNQVEDLLSFAISAGVAWKIKPEISALGEI